MNLLQKELTENEILKCTINNSDFHFDISEGGYISNDSSVILIAYRRPYIGQLLQFKEDIKQEIIDLWVSKIYDMINPIEN